jgi:hypothetical protein
MESKPRCVTIGENKRFRICDPSNIETELGADGDERKWMAFWAHSAFCVSVERWIRIRDLTIVSEGLKLSGGQHTWLL